MLGGGDLLTAFAVIAASMLIGAILHYCAAVILHAHHRKGPR